MGQAKKVKKSYVISMRISTEERNALHEIMANQQIRRISDLMRQAMAIMKQMPKGKSTRSRAARAV